MNDFVFKKIRPEMTAIEAGLQVSELFKLDLNPDTGCVDPERQYDAQCVLEALRTGRQPSRKEMRKRMKAKEAATAHFTDDQCKRAYAATLEPDFWTKWGPKITNDGLPPEFWAQFA